MQTTTDAFTKSLMNERDDIITKHDALVDRITILEDALQAIIDLSDLDLSDGDGAKQIASEALQLPSIRRERAAE